MNKVEKFGLFLILLAPLAQSVDGWLTLACLVLGTFGFMFGDQIEKG